MIEEQGIPISCIGFGFEDYHNPNDRVGKYMLAVATIGGHILLSPPFSPHSTPSGETATGTETMAGKMKADGG